MKLTRSKLKELVRQAIREIDFKNQAAFDAYNKKHKMRKSTKVKIAGKDTTAGDAEKSRDKGDDIEKQTMDAAKKANQKMEIDVLNKQAEKGDGAQIDTEYGTVTWTDGDPDEDSFIATNEDGEEVEVDYADIIRFHNDNDSIMKNLNLESVKKSVVLEKFGRRFTVKEIKQWMKTLEENRYRKIVKADARRVAWLVNNNLAEDYESMPKSIRKKWAKASYGRERYLAKEFIKSKKLERKLRESIRKIIKRLV